MNENKHERFLKVAGHRMDLLICDFRKLGNCASKSTYDYTEEEVELIFKELDLQIQLLREKFEGKKRFSLSTAPEDSY
ncbi:hypothetical protein [Pseudoflavonifractor capillosus]|uniref:hypothetical protein n=1 Tax=Pseudoflavonifractor capillosus TaxID=106588 RepID=UPI00195F221F|nr:hypothetical protein [Pseudoflavonifractor capillosus]MBM6679147.1 hypothetical protein [Pseudoflavonifractor capillosus]